MKEPYRLWFEFLKLAYKDPSITVDADLYSEWGDVANANFDPWWNDHWRHLFALPTPTQLLANLSEVREAISDPDSLVIRISLRHTTTRSLREVKALLDAASPSRTGPRHSNEGARFELDAKRSVNIQSLRIMLRMYGFWLDHAGDAEIAATAFFRWADAWNNEIAEKKWRRTPITIPTYLREYIDLLDQKKMIGRSPAPKGQMSLETMRSQTVRYIRRAQKIAQNVSKGVFPGYY